MCTVSQINCIMSRKAHNAIIQCYGSRNQTVYDCAVRHELEMI